ncbi:MAG: DUF4384 domain-containing protein [Nitrospirota bacterium]|nr:DUF4384 domain-containing protein [Nitrospirota bacterium]MDH5773855.1 DUF4384 domain-containing protein [Nitrospirota bacterium]
MFQSPTRKPWLLLLLCLFLAGCPAAAIIIPPLVQFGASLLDSAVNNHDEIHEQNMQTLLTALQQRTNPYMAQGSTAFSNPQAGGYSQPSYQTREYPIEQGYPPSPDYSQQGYDPYQNSQPQYEGNSPYPNTQDPNQFSQGNPYANNPNIPQQPAPPSGYPTYEQNEYPYQEPPGSPSQPMQPQYPQQGQPYPGNDGQEGMMVDPSTQLPYEGTPGYQTEPIAMGEAPSIPISLDVLLVKKHLVNGVSSYLPIQDGETLFDGRGNPQAGDKFRVMFRANTNCYVYVIAVDGSAWAQGIFPSTASPFANPVKAGQQYLLPEGNNWFSLDQFKGVETIFVVASHERRPDIEQILATISGRERHPAEKLLAVSEPAIIPNGYSGAHPGASPFAFKTSQRSQQQLLPTTYFVKTAGEDLRITRWFRHQ